MIFQVQLTGLPVVTGLEYHPKPGWSQDPHGLQAACCHGSHLQKKKQKTGVGNCPILGILDITL